MDNLVFLKLGGSAITDKTSESTAREDVIRRVAGEVHQALERVPELRLVLGHGSGSFGHYAAKTSGFGEPEKWSAYAATGAAAARLNRLVTDIMLGEGVPVVSMQPSASARCRDGQLIELAVEPVRTALSHGLIPLLYGDVAFDDTRGRSIASTEMIFRFLALRLKPVRVILAGNVDGAFSADPLQDPSAALIREITPANAAAIEAQLRGSHGVDVTGGMLTKVKTMLELVESQPGTQAWLLSALRPGAVFQALTENRVEWGTVIRA